jgi:hypothetical protein
MPVVVQSSHLVPIAAVASLNEEPLPQIASSIGEPSEIDCNVVSGPAYVVASATNAASRIQRPERNEEEQQNLSLSAGNRKTNLGKFGFPPFALVDFGGNTVAEASGRPITGDAGLAHSIIAELSTHRGAAADQYEDTNNTPRVSTISRSLYDTISACIFADVTQSSAEKLTAVYRLLAKRDLPVGMPQIIDFNLPDLQGETMRSYFVEFQNVGTNRVSVNIFAQYNGNAISVLRGIYDRTTGTTRQQDIAEGVFLPFGDKMWNRVMAGISAIAEPVSQSASMELAQAS